MAITTVSLSELSPKLKKPFELVEVAQVDELGVYVYVAHGRLGWHRHVDEDELFLVLSGLVVMESEWGGLTLHAGELALMPKGVGHRSHSMWRSLVLLVRPKILAHSQNGHRRLYGVPGDEFIRKINLNRAGAEILPDYSLHVLEEMGAYQVLLQRGVGISPWWRQESGSRLVMAQSDRGIIEDSEGETPLAQGEIAIIPPQTHFRIHAERSCLMLHISS